MGQQSVTGWSACLAHMGPFLMNLCFFLESYIYYVANNLFPTEQKVKEELRFCGSIIFARIYTVITTSKKQN
jgi:hypothetical protein